MSSSSEELAELYRPPRLPWLRVNMVSTLDGAATGESGQSGSINNQADKAVFDALRAQADAIIVGAGTARTENYRVADVPLVLVSRSAQVPEQLLEAPAGKVLVATCASSSGLAHARELLGDDQVVVVGETEVDLAALKAALVDRGHLNLLSEGGPHLLRDLVASGAADELCLTTVPRLIGGSHPRILGGDPVGADLELALLLEDDGTLLARWFVA
ncbi:dihydrofolate reductase family protein [Marmoricola sp. OAE513]|uniref:dihydrofolate reductase family protein n=1 Tax=Marmoricola sp. OAE513 TaxID=2817894 RepID=UPI001D469EB3